jgi:hypothetical protein
MRHVTHINPVPGPFSFSARSQPERRARSTYPKDHRHNTDERTSASRQIRITGRTQIIASAHRQNRLHCGVRGEGRRGWLQAGPPGFDDHVVGYARVDGVMQAEADDTVIVRVERADGVLTQHGAEGIDERLPEAGPVAARPGPQRDCQAGRARVDGGRPRRKPVVELLFPPFAFIGPSHPG